MLYLYPALAGSLAIVVLAGCLIARIFSERRSYRVLSGSLQSALEALEEQRKALAGMTKAADSWETAFHEMKKAYDEMKTVNAATMDVVRRYERMTA